MLRYITALREVVESHWQKKQGMGFCLLISLKVGITLNAGKERKTSNNYNQELRQENMIKNSAEEKAKQSREEIHGEREKGKQSH